ncbi:MAG: histidine kinase [Niabella sp.]
MLKGKKLYWVCQLAGWSAFVLWIIFGAWSMDRLNSPEERLITIQRGIGFGIIGLIMTHCLRIILIKLNVFSKNISRQIWMFIISTLIISFVTGVIEFYIYNWLKLMVKSEKFITSRSLLLIFLNNALAWFTYFSTWSAIYFIYHYVTTSQKEQIDTLKLKSHIKELELKTIKTHINPHFIFNSLNGIRAMVDEDPQRARTAITELSNILRSSINIDKSEMIPLSDELKIIKDYLALEEMRFENRLHIEYDISENAGQQQVPPMMWQMMVENAIKHGISQEINGGTVKLMAHMNGPYLNLSVENTGKLKPQQKDGGFGIRSIRERLQLIYGDNASFNILQSAPQVVNAKLELPIEF